jgi:hypothetical protein
MAEDKYDGDNDEYKYDDIDDDDYDHIEDVIKEYIYYLGMGR